jgi:hypothetical protein
VLLLPLNLQAPELFRPAALIFAPQIKDGVLHLGSPRNCWARVAARLRDPSTFWAASSQPTTCFDAAGPVVLGLLAAAEKLAGARVEARAGP